MSGPPSLSIMLIRTNGPFRFAYGGSVNEA